MIYKLFLFSFVCFSMLVNDSVKAQERYCRTTGCDNRTFRQVIDQCRRAYGSNVFQRESCDKGRFRYRCCTAPVPSQQQEGKCLDTGCSNRSASEIESVCSQNLGTSNFIAKATYCDGGLLRFQCCTDGALPPNGYSI